MAWWDNLFNRISNLEEPKFMSTKGIRVVPTSGRVSMDTSGRLPFQLFIREDFDKSGKRSQKYLELTLKDIAKMDAKILYEILVDNDPEVSLALDHFTSFCNVGHKFEVMDKGLESENDQGQLILNDFGNLMESYYGGFDVLLDSMFYSIFVGGAIFVEIVLDNQGREIVDFIVINPYEAKFEKRTDLIRGPVWELGQIQGGKFESLADYETITYLPHRKAPGKPYGRPPMSSTVFSSLFLVSILRDLELVIRHQGWERLDIVLKVSDIDELRNLFDKEDDDSKKIIDQLFGDLKEDYKNLKPDDIFMHTDHWEMQSAKGTSNRFAFAGLADIIQILERRIIRGLKSQPLLMGSNEAVTETHANRQWEIYAAGIRSVQEKVGRTIGRLSEIALQAQGVVCDVQLLFEEFRDAERLRDLQADYQELLSLQLQREAEWVDDAEAKSISRRVRSGRRRSSF